MTRYRRLSALSAAVASLTMMVAACGGDDGGDGGTTVVTRPAGSTDPTDAPLPPPSTSAPAADVPEGGTLVIGMEQEGNCMDWMATCSGTAWTYWAVGVQTMPRAFDTVKQGDDWVPVPSILLDGEPELVTEPQQVVTYRISPDAVWSDGTPITSSDFRYTWEQVAHGTDIYDTSGYSSIESVDDSDPSTAVVTFSAPYASWKSLFGGNYGLYPAHLLEGQDRNAAMADGYDWSGGPWKLESWNRGVDMTLVPNDAYWGEQPKLDKVVFRLIADTTAEFQAYRAGEVDAIYPQPQLDVIDAIGAGIDGSSAYSAETGNIEAIWLNNSEPPFDSEAVRRAFAHSLDRGAIVEALFGGLGITEPWQTLNAPILSIYSDTEAFADYTQDLAAVDELMTGDGWAKNSDGVWAKDGQTASFTLTTTAANARRILTQEIVQQQANDAGFDVELEAIPAGDLFGQRLPAGDFDAGVYSLAVTSVDPILCVLFCAENIPSDANGRSGNNWTRTDLPALEPLLEEIDTNPDEAGRRAASQEAERILADEVVSIPLDALASILIWSDRVVGPVADNPVLGPWWNLHELGVAA